MDVSGRALDVAESRLKLDRLAPKQRERIRLIHGSLMYRDARLAGFDAASIVEVIEHLDQPRLLSFERVVFEAARPRVVVLTTPNGEYNVRYRRDGSGTRITASSGQVRSSRGGQMGFFSTSSLDEVHLDRARRS